MIWMDQAQLVCALLPAFVFAYTYVHGRRSRKVHPDPLLWKSLYLALFSVLPCAACFFALDYLPR